MGLNRRGFLYGAVTVGTAAVVTAGFGRMLQRRYDIDDERAELALPQPSSSSPAAGAQSSTASEFDFGIDGISAFVTPDRRVLSHRHGDRRPSGLQGLMEPQDRWHG